MGIEGKGYAFTHAQKFSCASCGRCSVRAGARWSSVVARVDVALLNDHVEVVVGEAQVFSEEGARDAAGACFAAEPGFFDGEVLGCFAGGVESLWVWRSARAGVV